MASPYIKRPTDLSGGWPLRRKTDEKDFEYLSIRFNSIANSMPKPLNRSLLQILILTYCNYVVFYLSQPRQEFAHLIYRVGLAFRKLNRGG
jgi:hypothetical protein